MSENLPASSEELLVCDGMNERKILQYGNALLDITRKYAWELMELTGGDLEDPGEGENNFEGEEGYPVGVSLRVPRNHP